MGLLGMSLGLINVMSSEACNSSRYACYWSYYAHLSGSACSDQSCSWAKVMRVICAIMLSGLSEQGAQTGLLDAPYTMPISLITYLIPISLIILITLITLKLITLGNLFGGCKSTYVHVVNEHFALGIHTNLSLLELSYWSESSEYIY